MSASADVTVTVKDDVDIDAGLDRIRIKEIAPLTINKITAGLDPLTINKITAALDPITLNKITAGVDPVSILIKEIPKLFVGLDPIELKPITLNLAIKEIPSVRVHLPLHFGLGLSIFGHSVIRAKLAGEAQIITEPYEPNACEHCDHDHGKAKPAKAAAKAVPRATAAAPKPRVKK